MVRGLRYRSVDFSMMSTLASLMFLVAAAGAVAADNDPKPAPTAEAGAAQPAPAQAQKPGAGQPRPDPSTYGLADVTPFSERTAVDGKIDLNLQGVWLLVANVEVIPGKGKFRTFPQLLKITQGKDGPQFQMLDVQLPPVVQQSLQAEMKTMAPWVPSEEVRRTLGQSWSTLPPYKQKNIQEMLYGKIEYLVMAPDRYGEALKEKTETVKKALDASKLGMRIVEEYKPRELPPDSRVSQLMQRTTIYGVKAADKDTIKGDLSAGFLAAGAGFPMPFEFPGQFAMYKVAPL